VGVVATNGSFNKAQMNKVASMAHNGLGRVIRPAHSMVDGDTIFALATGKVEADINVAGLLAARAVERAIVRAVKQASSLHGFIAYQDLKEH
jgi:L-aminopeptidase/D-esterase-like protein